MSFRIEQLYIKKQFNSLQGEDFIDIAKFSSPEDLNNLYRKTLKQGMHGICFSLYEDGQKPGDIITAEQIRRRMSIIAPYSQWVRSFSCTEGNELIPQVARAFNKKTLVGAWLGNDKEKNKLEIEALIKLAKSGYVDIAAVGNEVLYRHDLSEDELLDYINEVKVALKGLNIPVGYVDAYYEFAIKPRITDACDVLLTNCYPFWEGTSIDYALMHMKNMFYQTLQFANGKKVIITETGWPSQGESLKGAVPSHQNFIKYFVETQMWTQSDNIEIFYFSSFDESWKVGVEGEVGAFWGLWNKNEQLKF
jgi:exo-beta-1,3-glucanase (GH17 family)